MKKTFLITLLALFATTFGATAAPDLTDILQGLGGKKDKTEKTTEKTTDKSDDKGGGLGGILEGVQSLGNKLGIIPSKTVDIAYLEGVWDYKKPAVAFKSENLLAKAGGVAASAKVESELEPYYQKAGLDKMVLTVNADSTFTMKLAHGQLNGTIVSNPDKKTLTFKFKVLGVSLLSTEAFVNAETNKSMSLTFDVTKLLVIIEKVTAFSGSLSGKTSLKALDAILKKYDGMTAGFYLTKTGKK